MFGAMKNYGKLSLRDCAKVMELMCPLCSAEVEDFLPYGGFCKVCDTAFIIKDLPPELERRLEERE